MGKSGEQLKKKVVATGKSPISMFWMGESSPLPSIPYILQI